MSVTAMSDQTSAADSFAELRRAMVNSQLRVTKVTDEAVVRTFGRVPREMFVPQARQAFAYADEKVPLGKGRSLMQPLVLARLLSAASPRLGDKALVVGAGLGFSAAVLADIGLSVVAVESDAEMAATARLNLAEAGYPHVEVLAAEATAGHAARAPYDLILIDGAADHVPDALIAQLAETGTLLGVISDQGAGKGFTGRKTKTGGFGIHPFMDALVDVLPGFEKPKSFTF